MPTRSHPPAPADLLREAGWLHALALRLVRDEARADDVVQETWRRALEKPPRDRRALPAWLARTARNAAWEEHRRDGRRRVREARVARPEAVPAVDDVVARTELHRRLVDMLLALEEPFRSTLLLRYFDDLTPKEIAKRTGVPAATVRTRLKRGLDRLRAKLDAAHGGNRRVWVLPLVPWARDGAIEVVGTSAAGAGASAAAVGGAMAAVGTKKAWIGVVLVLVLLGGSTAVVSRLLSPASEEESAESGGETDGGAEAPLLVGRAEPAAPPADDAAPAPAPARAPWTVAGSVRTIDGAPVANAVVVATLHRGMLAEVMARGFTNETGAFALDCAGLDRVPALPRAAGRLQVTAWADGFAPGPEDSFGVSLVWREALSDLAPELVLHRGRVFTGRVLDTRGATVSHGEVYAALDGKDERFVASTQPDGTYRARIPGPGRYAIRSRMNGVGTGALDAVDAVEGKDVYLPDLVLRGEGEIAGTAHFPDGSPAPFVEITCSAVTPQRFADPHGLLSSRAVTDGAGRFALRGLKRGRYTLRPRDFPHSARDPAFDTGESTAGLVIDCRRVLVRVEDPAGRGVPGIWISGTWIHPDGSKDFEAATLNVHARHTFWVPVGERLLISAALPGSNYAEAAVDVEEQPWDREILLTLRRVEEETGRIRIQLTGDDGSSIPRMLVTVRTGLTGRALTGLYEFAPGADGLLPSVPVGTWDVEIVPGRFGNEAPIEPWFPVRRGVTVRPRAVTEIEETVRGGGRIRLTLHLPDGAELLPRDVVIAATRLPRGKATSLGAWVSLTDRGWRMGGLRFLEPCTGRTLLEPGEYVVSIEAPGFARYEQTVTVPAGEIVDVAVDLAKSAALAPPPAEPEPDVVAPDLAEVKLGQMTWDDTPLNEIVAYLAEKLELEIRYTEKATRRCEGLRIHLFLDDVSAATLLDLCMGSYPLTWRVVGRTLWIGGIEETLPPR